MVFVYKNQVIAEVLGVQLFLGLIREQVTDCNAICLDSCPQNFCCAKQHYEENFERSESWVEDVQIILIAEIHPPVDTHGIGSACGVRKPM